MLRGGLWMWGAGSAWAPEAPVPPGSRIPCPARAGQTARGRLDCFWHRPRSPFLERGRRFRAGAAEVSRRCRVLPSTATTGERRGRRRTACRTRKGRPRRAQAGGPCADSTTYMSSRRFFHILIVTALSAAALLALAAPAALAKTYSDVPASHWAYSYI